MKKKVTHKKSTGKSRASSNDSFLIIVGGGFVIVTLILFFSGMLPFSLNLLDISRAAGSSQTLGATTTQQIATVRIQNGTFSPEKLLITKGAEVVWINDSKTSISAAANDGSFDSGEIPAGAHASVVFTKGGIYPYHETADPAVTGVVLVLQ